MDTRFQELQSSLESAVRGMSDAQLAWHPANKWSAADILEHLFLSYTGTIRGSEKMLAGGKPLATRPTMRDRLRTLVVLSFNYLPSGREAPASTRPKGLHAEDVRGAFSEKLATMDALITQCEDRFGRNTPLMDHPFLGPFTARQWRKFHLIHGLHHRKQILWLRANLPEENP